MLHHVTHLTHVARRRRGLPRPLPACLVAAAALAAAQAATAAHAAASPPAPAQTGRPAPAAGDAPADPARAIPRDPSPRWWKGNLHTHTFWSDGNDFPEMVAEWYADHGYNFLALTDHNVLSEPLRYIPVSAVDKRSRDKALAKYLARWGESWVQTRGSADDGTLEVRLKPLHEFRALVEERGRFILIPGEEITGSTDDGKAIHMNASNLAEFIEPATGPTVRDIIRQNATRVDEQAQRLGREILLHVNHPNYKWGVTAEDLAAVTAERFVEIENGVDGDNDPGDELHASTEEIWDIANTLRIVEMNAPPLFGLATDDSHDYHEDSPRALPGRAWVMVRAAHLTPESILRAMKAGDFYASTGVTYRAVAFDPAARVLSLEIDAVPGESYTTRFIGTRRGVSTLGTPRTDATGEPLHTTRRYGPTPDNPHAPVIGPVIGAVIGEVLAEVQGQTASYTFRGDELYVRAVTTSTAPPDVPSRESLLKKAWTQPVGDAPADPPR